MTTLNSLTNTELENSLLNAYISDDRDRSAELRRELYARGYTFTQIVRIALASLIRQQRMHRAV